MPRRPSSTDSRGFALPLMLGVLAVGGLLITASFLLARLELQSGENGFNALRALEAAESGLSETVAWWDPARYNLLAPGDSITLPPRTLGRGGYAGKLTRLSPVLFEIESVGWYQAVSLLPSSHRVLRSLVRLVPDGPRARAALTVIDTLVWDGTSIVSGNDTIPPGWGGSCAPDSSVAGVVTPPTAQVVAGSCPACFSGAPPMATDSGLNIAALTSFGSGGYAGLAARASHALTGTLTAIGPSVSGGTNPTCLVTDSLNWGEPLRAGPFVACAGYLPIIHAPGNLTLAAGRGQGTLLVDGDLEISGGFEFVGMVVVLGSVRNGPGGGSILGALLARNVSLTNTFPTASLRIYHSACVLPTTALGPSLAIPLRYRNWAQSF